MSFWKKSKHSKKDPPRGLASGQSDSPGQSSGGNKPQQAALTPPTMSPSGHLLDRFKWRSRSPSPSLGEECRNITTDQPTAKSTSQSNTAQATHRHPLPNLLSPTAGVNVTAVPSGGHGSPSSSNVQGPSFASVCMPTIRVSHSQSGSITGAAPPSTCVSNIPTSTSQIQTLVKTDVHTVCPQTKPTPAPGVAEPSPYSSVVWAKALDIAKKTLCDNNLPPLDIINLTSQSAEENIEAVVNALNTLQQDEKRKRWKYTWRGKEVIIVENLGKILRCVEKYSRVVDTTLQGSPQVSTLVWAGVRAIMQVRTQYINPVYDITLRQGIFFGVDPLKLY